MTLDEFLGNKELQITIGLILLPIVILVVCYYSFRLLFWEWKGMIAPNKNLFYEIWKYRKMKREKEEEKDEDNK